MAIKRVQYVETHIKRILPFNGARTTVDERYWAFNSPWSYDDDRLLVLSWTNLSISVNWLAQKLGRTPGSVYAQAQKIGLPLRRPCAYQSLLMHIRGRASTIVSSIAAMSLDNVRVVVRPDTSKWLRPFRDRDDTPATVVEKYAPTTRLCLMCRKPFRSSWIGNRTCGECAEIGRQML